MVFMPPAYHMIFAKCFDTVPVDLALHIFNIRGADCKVIKAPLGILSPTHKIF